MSAETTPGGVPASASQPPFGKNWSDLINGINQGNCILVLGPKAAIDPSDPSKPILSEQFAQRLQREIRATATGDSNSVVSTDEGHRVDFLISMATEYEFRRLHGQASDLPDLPDVQVLAREFYEPFKELTSSLHENLARVPFRVCLCTTPDSMLANAFRKIGKNPIEEYYSIDEQHHDLGGDESSFKGFTAREPLVYHLMGNVVDAGSRLLLTEDDLMDLILALMKRETALPQQLTQVLQSTSNPPIFLFIGFGLGNTSSRFLIKLLCGRRALPQQGDKLKSPQKPYYCVEDTVMMYDSKPILWSLSMLEFANKLSEEFSTSTSSETGRALVEKSTRTRPLVFLCHCSDDKDRIAWMRDDFSQHEIDCWFDKDQLRGGDRWDDKIQRVIQKEIDYFVIVASNSMKKYTEHYFYKEINAAIERYDKVNKAKRIFILPVVIDDCHNRPGDFVAEINNRLDGLQCTDLFHDPERRNFEGLVKDILEDFKKRNGNT